MRPESHKVLWDASQAVDRVTRFVAGKTFHAHQADELLRSAVERQSCVAQLPGYEHEI
jgi:uncharacterized protein with HEPN domain